MSNYTTEQRRLLMLFLQCNPDKRFSAREIAEALADADVSLSAVYRNLAYLEKQGTVSRSVRAGQRESLYRYAAADGCRSCLHLSCVKCGTICHMKASAVESILPDNGFTLDRQKTVLYGICHDCAVREEERAKGEDGP